jgi:hypothetical protein
MIGVSSFSITNLLKNCPFFKGVYSCNQIPTSLQAEFFFSIICNLSTADQKGSHFITIAAFKDYVFYIDSLGWKCFNPFIKQFLLSLNRTIFINQKQYQEYTSSYCGLYCTLHVLHFGTPREYQRINKLVFSANLEENDKMCIKYIKKLLKYHEIKT